jgi:hypothetical protein
MVLLVVSCGGVERRISSGLRQMVEEDLEVISGEIRERSPSALLERPYYRITEYSVHPESRLYTHKAVVDFFYMDSIFVKQVRKYRYQPSTRIWDRYDKKIRYIMDGKG